jgi:hypothetical protein
MQADDNANTSNAADEHVEARKGPWMGPFMDHPHRFKALAPLRRKLPPRGLLHRVKQPVEGVESHPRWVIRTSDRTGCLREALEKRGVARAVARVDP